MIVLILHISENNSGKNKQQLVMQALKQSDLSQQIF
jgi:hypothetical protein